jgi:archaellin
MRGFERMIDEMKIVPMGGPVLLNAAGITGVRVSMKNYSRLGILLQVTPASGTDPAAVTLKQSKTVADSPSTEKALSFTKVYKCVSGDTWAEVAVTNDTFNTSNAAVAESFFLEIDENDLDVNNGFDCVRINVADPGSVSTPAVATGFLYQAKFKSAVATQPSSIVD